MGSPLQNRPNPTAGPLLATLLVLLLGMIGCLMLQAASGAQNWEITAAIVAVFVAWGCLSYSLRDRVDVSLRDRVMWTFRPKPESTKMSYQLRPQSPPAIDPSAPHSATAEQTPPTLERIREIKGDDSRTWVPARHRKA